VLSNKCEFLEYIYKQVKSGNMKDFSITKSISKSGLYYLLASIFMIFSIISTSRADNTITSGTTLRVSAGTTMVSAGTLTVKSGGAISNLGTVSVTGNLDNQNTTPADLGVGTFLLNGASLQNVNGLNTFGNLTINNASGVALNGNTAINGVLNLTNGLVSIGSNNLSLGTSASISGSPSASAMVIATGTGEFRKSYSGAGSFTFPVGDNTGIAEYTPVTLAFTGGTYGSGNYAGVSLVNTQYPGIAAVGNYLNRYWNVTQSGIAGYSCNAVLQYVPADVTGTESLIYGLRINPTAVDYYNLANTAVHQLTLNGMTSLGALTGMQLLANKNLNLTLLLQGLYNGSGTMRKAQNSSGNQFTGTTADQVTLELHNSSSYGTIVYSLYNVNLSTTGTCAAVIPGIHNGNYYLTVKHRNSIETTTATPVSFTGSSISYNFDGPSKAYGNNMILMAAPGTFYAIYGGDVNQDGIIDAGDMIPVDNKYALSATGYLPEDTNGDGIINSADMTVIYNNAGTFTGKITP
jgi:hypothetical protein